MKELFTAYTLGLYAGRPLCEQHPLAVSVTLCKARPETNAQKKAIEMLLMSDTTAATIDNKYAKALELKGMIHGFVKGHCCIQLIWLCAFGGRHLLGHGLLQ